MRAGVFDIGRREGERLAALPWTWAVTHHLHADGTLHFVNQFILGLYAAPFRVWVHQDIIQSSYTCTCTTYIPLWTDLVHLFRCFFVTTICLLYNLYINIVIAQSSFSPLIVSDTGGPPPSPWSSACGSPLASLCLHPWGSDAVSFSSSNSFSSSSYHYYFNEFWWPSSILCTVPQILVLQDGNIFPSPYLVPPWVNHAALQCQQRTVWLCVRVRVL